MCVCILSLVIQHVNPLLSSPVVFSLAALLAVPYYGTFSLTNSMLGGKQLFEHKLNVVIFSANFIRNIFQSKKEYCVIINIRKFSCKVPVIIVRI